MAVQPDYRCIFHSHIPTSNRRAIANSCESLNFLFRSRLKHTQWSRLTLSRVTTAYFLFSIAHCIVQVSLQAKAFDINAHSATFIWDLAFQAKGFRRAVIPELHDSFLRLCPSVYLEFQAAEAQCIVVWDETPEYHPAGNANLPETTSLGEASTTTQDIPAPTSSPTTTSSSSVATSYSSVATSSVSIATVASTSSSLSTTGASAPTPSPSQAAAEEVDEESDDEFESDDESDDESIDGEESDDESDDEEEVEEDATVCFIIFSASIH